VDDWEAAKAVYMQLVADGNKMEGNWDAIELQWK